jgi:hypothetical protein
LQPLAQSYPTQHLINTDQNEQLVLWTPGDIDANCFDAPTALPEQPITVMLPPQQQPDKLVAIPVFGQFNDLQALQLSLKWPVGNYTFTTIVPGNLGYTGTFTTHHDNTTLQLVWTGPAVNSTEDTPLMTLYFTAHTPQVSFEAATSLAPKAYTYQIWSMPLQIQYEVTLKDQPVVYPNPTSGDVFVSIYTGKSEKISIEVIDRYGRLLYSQPQVTAVGQNRFVIPQAQSDASVFYARIIRGDNVYAVPVVRL